MAVIQPMVPDAGSRRALLRGAAAFACLAIVGCGGTPIQPARAATRDRWLDPMFGVSGGRLTDKTDPTGLPLPGGSEAYISFIFPVSVVATQGAIFIADAGHGRLFRYQQAGGLMAVVSGVRVNMSSRLRTGPAGAVFVLDAMQGEIRRYSMLGYPMPALHPRLPTSRYMDFDVDQLSGRVFASDPQMHALDQLEPQGRIALGYLALGTAGPVAIAGDSVLVADSKCQCVNEWRDQRLVRQFAPGQIRLPKAIAAADGEIYVLDGFDRSISRVHQGGLETLSATDLNLLAPEQISVSGGIMYVADGAGRSVAAFRIRRHAR